MTNIRSKYTSPADDEHYNDTNSPQRNDNNNNNNIDHGVRSRHHRHLSPRERISQHLGARRIEFISTAVICVVFAVSFAHLEYYYIKDPALQISNGKVQVIDPNFDRSRDRTNIRQYVSISSLSDAFHFYSCRFCCFI